MELVISSQGDTQRTLSTDPSSIERVLHNLVDNACKYAGTGPVRRVHLDLRVEGPIVRFGVSDHGPGIREEDRGRLFQAFERGTRQQDGSIPGLGLGLALSLGLARDVGGSLRLGDAARAEFVLELPLDRA